MYEISSRELIKNDFGVDLPITGGSGNSIDNPVVIESTAGDYVSVEYAYLKYIGMGRRIQWKVLSQALMFKDDRKIDKIRIEITQLTPTEIITQIEAYYFDITDACPHL